MSKDLLKYRFPSEASNTVCGTLVQTTPDRMQEGFIFSSFDASNCYYFQPSENEPSVELHFQTEEPYVFTQREYILQANAFLNGIHQLNLGKAVFSRVKTTPFDGSKAIQLYEELCLRYPNALVYLLSSKLLGTWIGASPEVLLEAHDSWIFTMALAGTKPTADAIEWGEKEQIEQELVTDFIVDQLKELQVDSIEAAGPYDFEAGPVIHLRTDISAEINQLSPWEVAQRLHPTPAVSGLPRAEAMALIQSTEVHDRGLYTGMMGILESDKARLYVNLRCAQIQQDRIFLYVGGGFTPQSVPELEWQETENKSRTLLNVIEQI